MSKDITYEDFRLLWVDSMSEKQIKKMWEDTKTNIVEKYKKGENMSPEAKRLAIKSMSPNKTIISKRTTRRRSPRRSPRKTTKDVVTIVNRPRSPSPTRSVHVNTIMENEAPVRVVMSKEMAIRFIYKLRPGDLFAVLNASPGLGKRLPVSFWVNYYRETFGKSLEYNNQLSNNSEVWMNMTRNRYRKEQMNH